VQPATLDAPTLSLDQPQVASTIPVSPEPQPAIATPLTDIDSPASNVAGDSGGQFSVLVFEDEAAESSAADMALELAAPAN
jgi:hypothetical protein